MLTEISVGELANRFHRKGDIHTRLERPTSADEGIKTQKSLQAKKLSESYQREVTVSAKRQDVLVRGRIDGLQITSNQFEFEEYLQAHC